MGYHPRFETTNLGSFITTRCVNSQLWFVNNKDFENFILARAAKCAERYSAKLYALAIEGNHIQQTALFPKANRSHYMRDFNSVIALAAPRYCGEFIGGGLWERRYSAEVVPAEEDIEEQFFYTVLQPIQDGLVESIKEYPGYNCFHDAVHGLKRKFKIVRWAEYNDKRRYCKEVHIKDFTDIVTLEYTRLPGYEDLSQSQYARLMEQKLEIRRQAIVQARYAKRKSFVGRDALLEVHPGARPKSTKKSTRESRRPRILATCPKRRARYHKWYFCRYSAFHEASSEYQKGNLNAAFPPGTYRPPIFTAEASLDDLIATA